MKKGIHPKVNNKAKVTCTCGNMFYTSSTVDDIQVEVCSNCHPFYTGEEKLIDTEGRVDQFKRRQEVAKKIQKEQKVKEKAKTAQRSTESGALSLKDMLKKASKT